MGSGDLFIEEELEIRTERSLRAMGIDVIDFFLQTIMFFNTFFSAAFPLRRNFSFLHNHTADRGGHTLEGMEEIVFCFFVEAFTQSNHK